MADISISYAEEDQGVARRIASALESEGLSVAWDHAAFAESADKTWDEAVVASAMRARCSIVLWSRHSAQRSWAERAAAAYGRRAIIPALIDDSAPPPGVHLISTAQLMRWNGDPRDPQWRMLVNEVRGYIDQAPQAARQSGRGGGEDASRPNWLVIGSVGGALTMAVAALAMVTLGAPAGAARTTAAPQPHTIADPQLQSASFQGGDAYDLEMERLRLETEAALAARARAEQDLAMLQQEAAARRQVTSTSSTLAGGPTAAGRNTWTVARVDNMAGRWRASAPRTFRTPRAGFFMITNRSRTEDGYAGVGAIVRVMEREPVGARVRVIYGWSRGCDRVWWVDDTLLTYLGPQYDQAWERLSDELHRQREVGSLPTRCGG